MAKKTGFLDPFEILNSELNGGSANARGTSPVSNSPVVNAPNAVPTPAPAAPSVGAPAAAPNQNAVSNTLQSGVSSPPSYGAVMAPPPSGAQTAAGNPAPSENSSCIGYIAKGVLIIFLAAILAWIIFMPSGSLSELKEYLSKSFFDTVTTETNLNGHHFAVSSSVSDDTATDSESTTAPAEEATTATTTVSTTSAAATTTTAATTTAVKKATATTIASAATAAETDSAAVSQNTAIDPNADYIYVYLKSQIVIVYDSDDDVRIAFTCSSGKASTPTKTGNYKIRNKYRWRLMIGNCYTQYASAFSSGYLFHSIPYNQKNAGTMSNASYDKLGTPASAGCVRLCFRDSKWIYDNCPIGTFVKVVDEYAPTGTVTETILPRFNNTAYNGWDPTDTDPANPYHDE